MHSEDYPGQGNRNIDSTCLDNPNLVSTTSSAALPPTMDFKTVSKPVTTPQQKGTTSTTQITETDGLSCIRNSFQAAELSTDITNIIMSSWRTGTKKQYITYIGKWMDFCREREINKYTPTLNQALSFLMTLYNQGLSYSTINTARSAMSTIISIPNCQTFGTHHLVKRFMKGIFEKRKPQPKYTQIWDVSIVLKYLATLKPNSSLSLKSLALKLVMLMLLVSGQRGQAIHSLSLKGMTLSEASCQFQILEHMKTSKPGTCPMVINIHKYDPDEDVCPLLTLKEYLEQTKDLRGNVDQLFISYQKPHKAVSRDSF